MKMLPKFVLPMMGLIATAGLFADDSHPASFRGDPLSIEAHWTTITLPGPGENPVQTIASSFNVVDDLDPATTLFTGDPFTSSSGQPYIMADFSSLTIYVPNWIDDLPLKEVRVQITWTALSETSTPPILSAVNGEYGGTPITGYSLVSTFNDPEPPVVSIPPDFVTNVAVYDIEITPNPGWESLAFTLSEPGISQVDIDTVSTVPEPASFALATGLLLAAFLLGRRLFPLRK